MLLPGYDLGAFWAATGMANAVHAEPEYSTYPIGFGDTCCGSNLLGGIAIALANRCRTGRGELVDSSLLGVGLWLSYRPVPGQLQGMVDAREIRVTSKVTGRIASFGVEEGQPVRQGQLLYTISSPEVAAKQQQAGGALEAAQATQDKAEAGARSEDIRAAEAQWRRAQAAANLAQDTSNRTQRLFAQGVVAGQKADEARTNAIASTEAAKAARAQYDQALAGARPQDKAAAGGQVQQARGAVAEVQAAAADPVLRAGLLPEKPQINKTAVKEN